MQVTLIPLPHRGAPHATLLLQQQRLRHQNLLPEVLKMNFNNCLALGSGRENLHI